MIVYPKDWHKLGVPITLIDIDNMLREVIAEIDCTNLSFSGGVDSSLLLYYLLEVKGIARCFSVANDVSHPDIKYSRDVISWFKKKYQCHIDHEVNIRSQLEGDALVQAYYSSLWSNSNVQCIITGDCIDELNCGYYAHQDMIEKTYQDYLYRLQPEHLRPLDKNSGKVAVYLPYADDRIANLFYRIPLYRKVNTTCRKIIIMQLAEGKVPIEVIDRKKYGFATSMVRSIT